MTYTGAATVTESRALLGSALAALQQEPNIPQDVLSVAENIAAAVGALFEAEQATSDVDGKSSVKHAMGSLSQTMALLQSVRSDHPGIDAATKRIAEVLSRLYPLTTIPSMRPPAPQVDGTEKTMMAQPRVEVKPAPQVSAGPREQLEANVGATTESNFFVGFSGDIGEGGVFVATYQTLPLRAPVEVLVTLPGGYSHKILGHVRFVRDPMDMDSEPGIGVGFESLGQEAKDLILRFIRKRPPLFFDI